MVGIVLLQTNKKATVNKYDINTTKCSVHIQKFAVKKKTDKTT